MGTVIKIAEQIGERIIELNGGKAPNAIFLVGGGAHTPFIKENLAKIKYNDMQAWTKVENLKAYSAVSFGKVDEFQDTSYQQLELIKLALSATVWYSLILLVEIATNTTNIIKIQSISDTSTVPTIS